MNNTANRMERHYFNIFDDFCMYWSGLSKTIVAWSPNGIDEITVRDDEGRAWVYSYLEKSIRKIYRNDDGNRLSEEEWRHNFSNRLKQRMMEMNIGVEELALRTGVSRQTISTYINARAMPNVYNISNIADVLECTVSHLIGKF